ncbi:glutathione S-transferase family protein [Sulfuriflexus mobilis]|uniref:glutathione S-transferase family protein n=1 Tax=Sulfuriflexus mobilis TaxID=1811807 RepID=UPI000F82DF81|nr:glutathione S-transferase family protein [Sulfuriflexus mobilis]
MSLLIKGRLREDWLESEQEDGEFVRKDSQFRNWVTVDGEPGPSGEGGFRAEPGRYHLYISHACPWAHRTLIFRALKKLEEIISISVVHPYMGKQGWTFAEYPGATADSENGFDYLHEVYALAEPDYSGIVTVPVLWDKQRKTIVNNESSEIIRMLNSAFDEWADTRVDLYPDELRDDIDTINAFIYDNINNGVYRTGFSTTQDSYEKNLERLFNALDKIEYHLKHQRYLVGEHITEADWRLFTTLLRFDPVYVGHFKCNLRRIMDYPNLSNYLRDLYQHPGIASTTNMEHIKVHYYTSHDSINPTGIVPKGPVLDYAAPHDRDRFVS